MDGEQLVDLLRRIGRDFRRRFTAVEVGHAQHVKNKHTVITHHGAARLGNDRRMRYAGFLAHALDAEHYVVGVLLQGVIDRRFEIGLRAVVVDAKPAAHVKELHTGADAV